MDFPEILVYVTISAPRYQGGGAKPGPTTMTGFRQKGK
jgi:hypothetical protein